MLTSSVSSSFFDAFTLQGKTFLNSPVNFIKWLFVFKQDEDFEEEEEHFLDDFGEYEEFDEEFDDEDEELQSFDDEFAEEEILQNDEFDELDDFDDDIVNEFVQEEEEVDKSDIESNQYKDDSIIDIIDDKTIEDQDYDYGEDYE